MTKRTKRTNAERRDSIDLMRGYAKTRRERQGRVPPRGPLPWPHGHMKYGSGVAGTRRRGRGGGLGGGGGVGLDAAGLLAMMGLLGMRAAKRRGSSAR